MKKTFPNMETVRTSDSPATLVFWHVVTWRSYPPRLVVISFNSWPRAFHGNDDFGDPNPAEYEMLREMAYAKKKQKASWINDDFLPFHNWEDSFGGAAGGGLHFLTETLRYQVIHAPW